MINRGEIVIADDDLDILRLLSLRLKREGWIISEHSNGRDALARAAAAPPALMLLDVMMPQMTGFEVLEAIRSHPDPLVAKTPLILLTASVQEESEIRAMELGADLYLRKPFDPRELISAVNSLAR